MDNLVALRLLMAAVITIATTAGVLAFAYMKFPDNAIITFFAVVLTASVVYFVQKKEKAARFEVYYATVQELGKPISYNKNSASFERNGTRFDVDFPQGEHKLFFKVNFYLPNLREKFSIQNKSLATTHHSDCYRIQEDSPLPEEYLLQTTHPAFLLNFLKNPQIKNEVLNYNASLWGRISISLEDGNFEMIWTPPISEQIDGFQQVCRSAVVFHDELKKLIRRTNDRQIVCGRCAESSEKACRISQRRV